MGQRHYAHLCKALGFVWYVYQLQRDVYLFYFIIISIVYVVCFQVLSPSPIHVRRMMAIKKITEKRFYYLRSSFSISPSTFMILTYLDLGQTEKEGVY